MSKEITTDEDVIEDVLAEDIDALVSSEQSEGNDVSDLVMKEAKKGKKESDDEEDDDDEEEVRFGLWGGGGGVERC